MVGSVTDTARQLADAAKDLTRIAGGPDGHARHTERQATTVAETTHRVADQVCQMSQTIGGVEIVARNAKSMTEHVVAAAAVITSVSHVIGQIDAVVGEINEAVSAQSGTADQIVGGMVGAAGDAENVTQAIEGLASTAWIALNMAVAGTSQVSRDIHEVNVAVRESSAMGERAGIGTTQPAARPFPAPRTVALPGAGGRASALSAIRLIQLVSDRVSRACHGATAGRLGMVPPSRFVGGLLRDAV